MSGTNRMLISDDEMEGESYEKMVPDLLNANEEAAKEVKETSNEEKTEKELWQKLLDAAIHGRRTGLGLHALGDAMAQLGLRYDSDDSCTFLTPQPMRIFGCSATDR